MKPIASGLLAIFAIAAPLAAQDYTPVLTPHPDDPGVEVMEERHDNGVLAKRFYLLNGKAHGLWQEWTEDGQPRFTASWRNGEGEGEWFYFHPNGQIRARSWVARDIWHGPTEGWYPDGTKAFDGTLDRGRKKTPFRYWDAEGEPRGPWVNLSPPRNGSARALDLLGWPDGLNRWDFNFTRDFETLFFATGDGQGEASNRRIMMRRWQSGGWQDGTWAAGQWMPPEPAPFSDLAASEGTPVVSYDGEWVYFSSDRHASGEPDNSRRDIYRASLRSGWKDVQRVTDTPLYGEVTVSLADDGSGVMWTGHRLDGEPRMGLYEVRLTGSETEPGLGVTGDLNDLHTGDPSGENYAVIARDGRSVIFANYGIDGAPGEEDLFRITRRGSGWSEPELLGGAINSAGNETSPQLIDEGRTLLFVSSRSGENIYMVAPLE